MNASTRHLVALVLAGNVMSCQLIKRFTDRHHDSGTTVTTGTTVITLDGGGIALPSTNIPGYDAAAANAAVAAANAAMANAADATAQANQALAAANNALADASAAMAAPPSVVAPGAPAPAPGLAAAPPPPAAAPAPEAPAPAPAAVPVANAPAAPAAEPDTHHHHHGDYCASHPGQLNPRTGQICPNILGAQNLQH